MAQIASKSCEICMSGPGQNYCQQCGQWLCNSCQSLHLRSKISKHHTFLSGPNINQDDKLFCNEHDDNFIFYCNECDIPICKLCIVKNHKQHDMSEINESTKGLQAAVQQNFETKIQTVNCILDRIEDVTEIQQSDIKEAICTLTDEGKQIKQWIDKKVQSLISLMKEKETETIHTLQTIKSGFQSDMEMLKKRQAAFKNRLEITEVTKRLKELKLIKSQLDEVEEKESPVMPTLKYFKLDIAEGDIIKLFEGISIKEKYYRKTLQENHIRNREVPICKARASVTLFDESSKNWVPAGSAQQNALSKVQIYRHTEDTVHNTFRVVGRKIANHDEVIHCLLSKTSKYNQATPTFHQWKNEGQVYGLNFSNKENADCFAQSMQLAIATLNHLHNV